MNYNIENSVNLYIINITLYKIYYLAMYSYTFYSNLCTICHTISILWLICSVNNRRNIWVSGTLQIANADQSSFRKAKGGGIERVKGSFLQMLRFVKVPRLTDNICDFI